MQDAQKRSKVKLSMNRDLWADDHEVRENRVLADAACFSAEQLDVISEPQMLASSAIEST
jgi:hypothetical protein